MARENWQDHEDQRRRLAARRRTDLGQADYSDDYAYDARRRTGYRVEDIPPEAEDYGQADFSTDFAYDAERREAYRRYSNSDPDPGRRMGGEPHRAPVQPRSWVDGARAFFSPDPHSRHADARPPRRRRGPSDRVLWVVIVERLEDERGLDLSDVEVIVEGAEVTLNGTVSHKADKRRIEDVADIDGVRHVQNNLRVREHAHWTFI